jgi:23S rRNA pseudouridine2604 synthase
MSNSNYKTNKPNINNNKPSSSDPTVPVRLSKLMAEKGICSRREADEYISQGLVYVDGVKISELGTKVLPTVSVSLDPQAMRQQKELVTIILNKPIGYVSAQPEDDYEPAIVLITPENQYSSPRLPQHEQSKTLKMGMLKGIAVAGRLDIDSQGLLVFTQDGRVARHLIGENSVVEKEYLVRVEGRLNSEDLKSLNNGSLSLDGKKLKPAKVEWLNNEQLRFVLTEGKKRQVRRMCEMVGLRVLALKRVRIGKLMLGDLPEGQWRFLGEKEII